MTGRKLTIYPDTREYAFWDVTCDQSLASATVAAVIDGETVDAEWADVQTGTGPYQRTARLILAGSDHPDDQQITSSKTALAVTIGDQVIVVESTRKVEFAS